VASSDCGGPTSDWPTCNQGDDREPTSGDPSDRSDNGAEGPQSTGDDESSMPSKPVTPRKDAGSVVSKADAGKATGSAMDAGAVNAGEPSTPANGGEVADSADAGVPDAHVAPSEDGGTHGVDSGLDGGRVPGSACSSESDGRDAGACFGVYCATTPDQLASSLSARGACLANRDLALVCDGELSRVVDDCAQDNARSLGFGSTVRACARAADSLEQASPGCIDCYVDERLCAVENCLTTCLAGRSMACTECRASRCGAAFASCSGLPLTGRLGR